MSTDHDNLIRPDLTIDRGVRCSGSPTARPLPSASAAWRSISTSPMPGASPKPLRHLWDFIRTRLEIPRMAKPAPVIDRDDAIRREIELLPFREDYRAADRRNLEAELAAPRRVSIQNSGVSRNASAHRECGNTHGGPNHQPTGDRSMADQENITIPLDLPRDEAAALSQFVKRVDYDTCIRFASVTTTYAGRSEGDVMWSAICMLQRQLAEAGFSPR
jgi:hypothetical protein